MKSKKTANKGPRVPSSTKREWSRRPAIKDAAARAAIGLEPALHRIRGRILELLARGEQSEAESRYEVGRVVLSIRENAKYGEVAVEKIARSLGRDASSLHDYANVVQCWGPVEFKQLMKRKSRKGLPLSISHLIELTGVRSAPQRAKLLEKALTEGLSVRDLRSQISEPRASTNADRAVSSAERENASPPAAILTEMISQATDLKSRSATWQVALADLEHVPPSPEIDALISRALSSQREVQELCATNIKRLEEEQRRLRAWESQSVQADAQTMDGSDAAHP